MVCVVRSMKCDVVGHVLCVVVYDICCLPIVLIYSIFRS